MLKQLNLGLLALTASLCACTSPVAPATTTMADTSNSSGSTSQPDVAPPPAPLELTLPITATDAAIHTPGDVVGVVKEKGPWSGKIVVLFVESGQSTHAYLDFLRVAALGGHHAIALPLPLQQPVTDLCGAETACYEAVRGELLDGQDRTPQVEIAYGDSLTNRLNAALLGLEAARPGLNWGTFAQAGKPLWSKLILVGHGEGAGHAAFVANQQVVARVVLLAGPTDGVGDKPAGWLTTQHLTPIGKWYAFGHIADPRWGRIAAGWTALGLGAGSLSWPSVDQGAVFGVQGMTTALASDAPGLAVATDASTPRDGEGRPRFRVTWRVLVDGAPY